MIHKSIFVATVFMTVILNGYILFYCHNYVTQLITYNYFIPDKISFQII